MTEQADMDSPMRTERTNRACAWRLTLILAAAGLVAGCAGPAFRRPDFPTPGTLARLPALTTATDVPGGAAQHFVTAQEVKADWWTLFRSPELNALVAKAFAANPTITAAHASLRAAQESVAAQQGLLLPTVQAGYTPARTKIAANQGGSSPGVQGDGSAISTTSGKPAAEGGTGPFNAPVIYNFHTAQLTVGFVPDVFGANRRQLESAQAQANYQQFQLEAAYITLASNVVAAAIQEALLRDQIATTDDMVNASVEAADLVRRQWKAGFASRLDVALQENALALARQQLPQLRKQRAQTRDLLRALAGGAPDLALPESFELSALTLPEQLPAGLPSRVVEQRPDVMAAEEQLRSAYAQLGVATANRLPQFSIDGTVGGAASHFNQMFWSSGAFFNLAANITQPIFDGGTLKHKQRAAQALVQQAEAQYQSTVIAAFQNVADALHALHADADALNAAAEVAHTSAASLALIRHQLLHGYVDRLALINSEQANRQAVLGVAQARAARLADTAALFQALGGGWEQAARPAAQPVTREPARPPR